MPKYPDSSDWLLHGVDNVPEASAARVAAIELRQERDRLLERAQRLTFAVVVLEDVVRGDD